MEEMYLYRNIDWHVDKKIMCMLNREILDTPLVPYCLCIVAKGPTGGYFNESGDVSEDFLERKSANEIVGITVISKLSIDIGLVF